MKRDTWNGVAIEIYYHPGHEYNLDRMIEAVKDSLDYYTRAFGPYQHRQVRILEFPRYAHLRPVLPQHHPLLGGIGFIAEVDPKDPEDVDYPYYVTAHEVAHQWWAHQVVGGDVQGATMLSETLAQYSALMVMKQQVRRREQMRPLPALRAGPLPARPRPSSARRSCRCCACENQAYIHYQQGQPGDVRAAGLHRRGRGEPRRCAALVQADGLPAAALSELRGAARRRCAR